MVILRAARRLAPSAILVIAASACGPSHRLGEYDFRGQRLSATVELPPAPSLVTGPLGVSASNPLEAVVSASARAARELSVRSARDGLERAAERVDMAALIEEDVRRRASRYLAADPWSSVPAADFVIEIDVVEYGISATDWEATAYFFLDARVVLLDQHRGDEIWRVELTTDDAIGPEVFGDARARDAVTVAAILALSDEDFERALERLCAFAAAVITDRLRADLSEARRAG